MLNMIQNLSTVEQDPDNNSTDELVSVENGLISNIAKELTDELKLDDLVLLLINFVSYLTYHISFLELS